MKLPEELKQLFWNYDTDNIDAQKFKKHIILEVLARGSMRQTDIIFDIYGKETIKEVFREDVKGQRTLPAPAVYLWGELFLTSDELDEYKSWHRHPLRKWEQRRHVPQL